MNGNEHTARERLAAWVDGTLGPDEARVVAGHVAACPACATAAEGLRAYRNRMRAYRIASEPDSVPAGFWPALAERLDRADSEDPALAGLTSDATGPERVRRAPPMRLAWSGAVLLLAFMALAGLWAWRVRPAPTVPVTTWMRATATPRAPMTGPGAARETLTDPDRAARWLSERLGEKVPPVDLTLVGARLYEQWADPRNGHGVYRYRTAEGTVDLHVVTTRRRLPDLPVASFRGSVYRVAEGQADDLPVSAAAWQADNRTFVAAGVMPLERLLPYAREMDQHCRRRGP